jgi:aldose 1-epimerase
MRLAATALALLSLAAAAEAAKVSTAHYGTTSGGQRVTQVTLQNDSGTVVKIIGYGAIITDIVVPDRHGRRANVALGHATLSDYETRNSDGFGAAIGRYAGRIANARFTLGGKEVRLQANDGPNALHGGPGGLDKKNWEVSPFKRGKDVGAVLRYASPDGEQGFPGKLDLSITYTLSPANALRIDYQARTDRPTVLNLTNHSYFNLSGAGSGSVRDHLLRIDSRAILATDERGIPSGQTVPVEGTPFDFRRPVSIGSRIDLPHAQMVGRRGFNHSWLLDNGGRLALAALVTDPISGRRLEVLTTEPSLHAYTANWFSGEVRGAQGKLYRPQEGLALETQHYPDAPNRPDFPSTELRPGDTFRSTTVFRFSTTAASAKLVRSQLREMNQAGKASCRKGSC